MKFKLLTVATVAIAIIYLACNRHTVQGSMQRPVIITRWQNDSSLEKVSFEFDDDQRVIKEETGNDISIYRFTGDSISITEFNKAEQREVYTFNGQLDSARHIVSGNSIASYVATSPDTIKHEFAYNKVGQLISEKKKFSSSSEYYIDHKYQREKLVQVSTYFNNALHNKKEITYFDDAQGYGVQNQFKFRRNINELVGKADANMVKEIVSYGPNGDKKYKLTYSFDADKNGYPVRLIARKGKKVESAITFSYKSALNVPNQSLTYVGN